MADLREPNAETAEYAANSANAAVVLVFSRQLTVASLIQTQKLFCGGSGGSGGGIDIGSGANVAVVAVENRQFCHGRNDFWLLRCVGRACQRQARTSS